MIRKPIRKAVFPVAGLGTRFLPISRAVPKELIPVVDTPVIEIVVTEMTESGIERVVLVVRDENAQRRADRRIGRRFVHRFSNFRGRRVLASVDDVEHFLLATAQQRLARAPRRRPGGRSPRSGSGARSA